MQANGALRITGNAEIIERFRRLFSSRNPLRPPHQATRDGDDYVIHGHKIWTSYSDVAEWCLLLARTDRDVPKHEGISAFIVPMHQPGIEQRPLKMISGVTKEFGQVEFDGARVSADNMVGAPGGGWKLAMTVVSHEREPSTLGFSARYGKLVRQMATRVDGSAPDELSWTWVQTEMLRLHVRRRLFEQLDGLTHGPQGSLDKLLMTWVEQSVGHAVLATVGTGDPELFAAYMYSRAQSVMGGTSQIQKNIIALRILAMFDHFDQHRNSLLALIVASGDPDAEPAMRDATKLMSEMYDPLHGCP
ncbi:hypothetical protein TUM20985_39200 [Mycobacterium antarcticum]|nr:hypothetical protein TUM20985_39200 [Mycolicibacterium sp. TUM20985]GLP83056.1 hypothetical protein TUM20984_44760 [Mycolicibacterium sp. TUM20984]